MHVCCSVEIDVLQISLKQELQEFSHEMSKYEIICSGQLL